MDDLTLEQKATNHETWRHIHQVQMLSMEVIQKLQERLLQIVLLAAPNIMAIPKHSSRH